MAIFERSLPDAAHGNGHLLLALGLTRERLTAFAEARQDLCRRDRSLRASLVFARIPHFDYRECDCHAESELWN